MSFDLNDIDRTSKPKVHNEELEQLRYIKTLLDKVAVRVGNEEAAPLYTSVARIEEIINGTNSKLVNVQFDTVALTYILAGNGKDEIGTATYFDTGVQVAKINIVYDDKNRIINTSRE